MLDSLCPSAGAWGRGAGWAITLGTGTTAPTERHGAAARCCAAQGSSAARKQAVHAGGCCKATLAAGLCFSPSAGLCYAGRRATCKKQVWCLCRVLCYDEDSHFLFQLGRAMISDRCILLILVYLTRVFARLS